jgi:hypothetical protein
MAVRNDFAPGEVLAAADLNDSLDAKLNLAGGKILQVVVGTTSTQATNNTNVYADTGLTATITPSSASSKVLVIISHSQVYKSQTDNLSGVDIKLFRGATDLGMIAQNLGYTGTAIDNVTSFSSMRLDEPATTSSTTYKTQFANGRNSASVTVQTDSRPSTITLMEVSA